MTVKKQYQKAMANLRDSEKLSAVMLSAKIQGNCLVSQGLHPFAQKIASQTGMQFAERYLNTEAARLGKTRKEMEEICRDTNRVMGRILQELH